LTCSKSAANENACKGRNRGPIFKVLRGTVTAILYGTDVGEKTSEKLAAC
jgi:hypothetical protein